MTIQEFIEVHKEKMIDDIAEFIAIPTVFDEETAGQGQPFGADVNRGLVWVLQLAESMGMEVKNIDGYAGEITIGDGPFMIGVLAHEDVVPAGEGWDTNPFEAVVKDGKIYGRGSGDDKGPLISSLYAMKYLKDENLLPPGTCVRLIVGTNEEEAWGGINYYTAHVNRLPDYSIVPDGYFPLVYCEKGLYDINLEFSSEENGNADVIVTSLEGGSGRNVVAGSCKCTLECVGMPAKEACAKLIALDGITAETDGNKVMVTAEGKSAHAMSPEKGINAISRMMEALGSLHCTVSIGDFIEAYNRYIGMSYNGEKLGIGFEDQLTGKLTMNIGTVSYHGNTLKLEGNLRYPASIEKEVMWQALEEGCNKAGFVCIEKEYLPPVYTEPDSPFVTRLMDVYKRVSGDTKSEAFTMGGATYARAIPNAAAFGPLFPYEEELAHEANEFLSIDSLEKMTAIYAEAIQSLLEMGK